MKMKVSSLDILIFAILHCCWLNVYTAQAFQFQKQPFLNRRYSQAATYTHSSTCRNESKLAETIRTVTSKFVESGSAYCESDDNECLQFKTNRRRQCLQSLMTVAAASASIPSLTPRANAAQTTGEAIRRSAANIPGYGQADIFYPSSFLGKWRATRVIVAAASNEESSNFPLSASLIAQDMLPLTVSYDVRFITVDGDLTLGAVGNEDATTASTGPGAALGTKIGGKVIADRQFNEQSYYNALCDAINAKTNKASSSPSSNHVLPSIQTMSWSPSNPNVLTTNYDDGSNKEIKVTKRAAELDSVNGIVSSSEYRRITTVAGTVGSAVGTAPGIPSISASRVLTKWKVSNDDNNSKIIEGIEIVYADGIVGDPMAVGRQQQQQPQPQLTSKCRLRLVR